MLFVERLHGAAFHEPHHVAQAQQAAPVRDQQRGSRLRQTAERIADQ